MCFHAPKIGGGPSLPKGIYFLQKLLHRQSTPKRTRKNPEVHQRHRPMSFTEETANLEAHLPLCTFKTKTLKRARMLKLISLSLKKSLT